MNSDDRTAPNHDRSFRRLGIGWVIYGIVRICSAAWLVSFSNTAAVMFGALLSRVSDPFTMMNFFHLFYTFVVALSVACGVLGLLAGWALLAGQKSGRTLALIAGFLSLSEIPLGIALGIYTLITLLPLRAGHVSTVILHDQTSDVTVHPSTT